MTDIVDMDYWAKKRIARWMKDNKVGKGMFDYDGECSEDDLADILLDFEKFLQSEEARRIKE